MSPFDFVNDILYGKKNVFSEETAKEYVPFVINRSLSYHYDCILYANEINMRHSIDKKLQNDFLINTIRSKKRPFAKWIKLEKSENIELLKMYFNFSNNKAIEALKILTPEDIQEIRENISIGGVSK